MKTVSVGPVSFDERSFGLIAGPCVIESRDHALKMSNLLWQEKQPFRADEYCGTEALSDNVLGS